MEHVEDQVARFVGIDVSKGHLDVYIRPTNDSLRVLTKDSCEFLCVCGEGCGLLQVVQ